MTSTLRQVDGVSDARVSYEQSQAVVTYDAAKTTPEAIAQAAEQRLPGYKLAVGGATRNTKESPKACARPAVATSSLVQRSQVDPERVTFYEAAWSAMLRPRSGTAVVPNPSDHLLANQGVSVRAVPADARAELLASFRSGGGWFDAASVDRLSEQEAGIIAARLVKRLAAKTTITPEQDAALRNAIEQACRKRFIDGE